MTTMEMVRIAPIRKRLLSGTAMPGSRHRPAGSFARAEGSVDPAEWTARRDRMLSSATATEATAPKGPAVDLQRMVDAWKALADDIPPAVRRVGTGWFKERWLDEDYIRNEDGIRVDLVPGAVAPGLYVRDRETYDAIVKHPSIMEQRRDHPFDDPFRGGIYFGSIAIRIATDGELAWFERQERKSDAA